MTIHGISHVGICVSDLQRSLRFYCNGMGFVLLRSFDIGGDSWSTVLEVENSILHSRILRRDKLTIELLEFELPGHVGLPERRPMNRLGFTHLAVWVDDIDIESVRIVEYGGAIVESTRIAFAELGARWLYCTDPDGIRLELIEYPAGQASALDQR